ncbi:MAG: hypothetical protein VX970_06975 [Planctomycetota bacterium]|nr:hypothetical protein [Planctomycetota bacterium]
MASIGQNEGVMEHDSGSFLKAQFLRRPLLSVSLTIGLVIVPAALLIGGPSIVSHTSLRQKIVPLVLPKLKGTCSIGAASLGWFSPVVFTDVDLDGPSGGPLMRDGTIGINRTLFGLITQGIAGATITVSGADIHLIVGEHSTNWEKAIEDILAQPAAEDSPPAITAKLETIDVIISTSKKEVGRVSDWTLLARYSPEDTLPLTVETSAAIAVADRDDSPGQISAVLRFSPAKSEAESPLGELTWETSGIQLKALGPLLARVLPESTIEGRITSIATIDWQRDIARVEVKLLGSDATFRSPTVLSGETLNLQRGNLELRATAEGNAFQVETFRFDSDFAEFELTAVGRNLLRAVAVAEENGNLLFENVEARGKLDLPRLTNQLPGVFRLRKNTKIDSGQVQFSMQLDALESGRKWNADIKASELAATANGRPLRWEQPIAIQLQLRESLAGNWQGDVSCASDYLIVKAKGSTQAGTVALTADLTQLKEDLEPLVDLGGLEIAGRMQASIDLAQGDRNQLDLNGQGILEGFRLAVPDGVHFEDPRMTLRLSARATVANQQIAGVEQAELRFDSSGDQASVQLTDPIMMNDLPAAFPLEIRGSGQLASWFKRVPLKKQSMTSLPEGRFDAEMRGRFSTTDLRLEHAQVKVQHLKIPLKTGNIEQPSLVLTGSGRWDRINGQLSDVALAARAPAVAVWTEKLNVTFPAALTPASLTPQSDTQPLPEATGTLYVRGDLAVLQPWISAQDAVSRFSLAGKAEGKFALQTENHQIAFEPELAIRDFSIQPASDRETLADIRAKESQVRPTSLEPIWEDQQLTLRGRLIYDYAQDRLQMERVTTGSRGMGVQDLAGSIEQLTGRPIANLQGDLVYDLAQATEMLSPHLDAELAIVGKGSRPIYYRGPLLFNSTDSTEIWWEGIEAGGGFSWDFFQFFGLRGGKGAFRAELNEGIIRGTRIDIPFGGGQLQMVPFVRFDSGPAVLLLSQDTILSRAMITEALCRDWLQYLAPVLADATRTEGQFSIRLTRSVVPVEAPEAATLEGTLTIHEAQIRPGPVTEQIATIAAQVDAIINRRPTPNDPVLKIDPQEVPFRMVAGRIEHHQFEIEIGDVVVRTSGSVGLDQTLDLVAEIPILQKWVDRDPILRGLAGQTLKLPIRGTVQNPKIDPKAIGKLSKQMLQGTANGFLNDAIDRGLQKGLQELFR